jgi:hypothetical protein
LLSGGRVAKALLDRKLPYPARSDVRRRRSRIGANAGDMDQSFHPARTREAGHARRCLDMHASKVARPRLT